MTLLDSTAVDRARAMRSPVLAAVTALGTTAYVGTVDPNQSGHYPTCPFLFLTGRYCPGCGSLRAVHALVHGDLGAAIGLNVLTVVGVVVLAGMWARWAARAWRGEERTTVAPPWVHYTLLVVIVAFGVVRNLPFGAALAP
jgi:hypothetical protein